MNHIAEHDLIAYQMNESPDATAIARHLESCFECAAVSASIAETLRVFSAEPVPQVNLEQAWQRMRGSLPALRQNTKLPWWRSRLVWFGPVFAALLCLGFVLARPHHPQAHPYANDRPGPLTTEPTSVEIANHIDSAERLLTEVNHSSGQLDDSTLDHAHALLLTNALYVQQAHATGDLAHEQVLENLGRVLTTLDHPEREKGWHVRLEMNTDGLLLDLRILQQNEKDTK